MSHEITLFYPDADDTASGLLYLPGEPIIIDEWSNGCALCGDVIVESSDATEQHGGIITTEHGVLFEAMHLRCVMDTADQANSIGFSIGNTELSTAGRHAV